MGETCPICLRPLDTLDGKCGSDDAECLRLGYDRVAKVALALSVEVSEQKARADAAEAREATLAAANAALADGLTRCAGIESDLAAARREGSDKERRLRQFLTMCADELDRADKNGGEWERVWDVRARLAALGATLGRLGEEEWLPSAALAAPAAGEEGKR